MAYDLVIRGGTVVDGSGQPGYRADVGVTAGKIAAIGKITERGAEEIDGVLPRRLFAGQPRERAHRRDRRAGRHRGAPRERLDAGKAVGGEHLLQCLVIGKRGIGVERRR